MLLLWCSDIDPFEHWKFRNFKTLVAGWVGWKAIVCSAQPTHLKILSPCEQGKKGGSKFNWKKISTCTSKWCQRMCPSVCLSVTNFDSHYLGTGRIEWAEFFRTSLAKWMLSKNLFVGKVVGRAESEGINSNILTQYLSSLTWDQAEIFKDFLAGNTNPYHSQGGMKFATQLSPILNFQLFDEIGWMTDYRSK